MVRYADVSILDISDGCFRDIAGESLEDLRTNVEGNRVIIKFEGDVPVWLEGITYAILTHGEAKSVYTRENGWI